MAWVHIIFAKSALLKLTMGYLVHLCEPKWARFVNIFLWILAFKS
jgi:hypothetical protein